MSISSSMSSSCSSSIGSSIVVVDISIEFELSVLKTKSSLKDQLFAICIINGVIISTIHLYYYFFYSNFFIIIPYIVVFS